MIEKVAFKPLVAAAMGRNRVIVEPDRTLAVEIMEYIHEMLFAPERQIRTVIVVMAVGTVEEIDQPRLLP